MRYLNNKGQALVEYILIIALISVVAIGAISIFGERIKNKITEASCSLVGQEYDGNGSCK